MSVKQNNDDFIADQASDWVIQLAQEVGRAELALSNKIVIDDRDISILQSIPEGCGVLLTPNHADEMDPRVCLELSRRSQKRFITMCNREAFDEAFGLAKWFLSRLGLFSVRRGAHDTEAKNRAIQVVEQAKDVLLIFPEGEIYYLNEMVQSFHSGAVEIAMQAIINKGKQNFTAYIVPMAIKYHYPRSIEDELKKRIEKMESFLGMNSPTESSLPMRARQVQSALLEREKAFFGVKNNRDKQALTQDIVTTANSILASVQDHHPDLPVSNLPTIDRAWQLAAEIRALLEESGDSIDLKKDLLSLKEVAQLMSWRPQYYKDTDSFDRLAESVLKLERECYRIHRPKQLAAREVYVRIAEPINLSEHVEAYLSDAHVFRHKFTLRLKDEIQTLVDQLVDLAAASKNE